LCGDPRWGHDADDGYATEQRERWAVEGNSRSTVEFLQAVHGCEQLVAVLAGHIHSAQAQVIGGGGAMQYVTAAGMEGGHRDIRFVPAGGGSKL
jgi:hypothetical protein